MLKLKQNHTPRDVKVLTDQLVDAVASVAGPDISPYMSSVLTSANAGAAQTAFGMSDFAKTLLDDPDSPTALSTLGFTSTGVALATAASASTALTALGVSPFAKTLLDDTDAASARLTLDAMSKTAYDNRPQWKPWNYLLNGDLNFWRYNSTQTSDNYGSADRWYMGHSGTTKTVSQQLFSPQFPTAVPGNPVLFARTVVTSVAGVNNRCFMRQPLEYVRTLAGKTITVTFYAKADAARNIAIDMCQYFGTGTGVSTPIVGIGAQKFALTTSWQKCQAVIAIPSVTGKVFSDSPSQSTLDFTIWFDAGSNFNARTASLGQQSGTFDIAHLSLIEGDASSEPDPFYPKRDDEEIAALMRYYQWYNNVYISGYGAAGGTIYLDFVLTTPLRINPTAYFYSTTYTNASAVAVVSTQFNHVKLSCKATAVGAALCNTGVELYAEFYGYQ